MKFRFVLKVTIITSVVLLCIGIVISLYFRMSATERAEDFDLYTLVPSDSQAILDTENMVNLIQSINDLNCSRDNHFFYFSRIFSYLKDHLNTLLENTPHGLSKQMNKMLLSFHGDDDCDQLLYCRLGAGDYEFVQQFIDKYCASSFPSRYFDYKGEEIRIYPMPDDTFLACYFTPEFLVLSCQKRLIEQVIDTRLNKNSILSDKSFAEIRTNKRMTAPATIYTRMKSFNMSEDSHIPGFYVDLGCWTEFNVNLSGDVIYLSGINYDPDSCATFINVLRQQEPVHGFPSDVLPASTFYFNRFSISDLESLFGFTNEHECATAVCLDSIMEGDKMLCGLLKEYAGNSLITCVFSEGDSLSAFPHTIINVPVNDAVAVDRRLASLSKSVPQDKTMEHPLRLTHCAGSATYVFYLMPSNTIFARVTGVANPSLSVYACLYKGQLLLSSTGKALSTYIDTMENSEMLDDSPSYEHSITTLSKSYHFMMMAEMERLFEQPDSCTRLLPGFFYRHRNFFRHFLFITQVTHVDQTIYPGIILIYKEKGREGAELPAS